MGKTLGRFERSVFMKRNNDKRLEGVSNLVFLPVGNFDMRNITYYFKSCKILSC